MPTDRKIVLYYAPQTRAGGTLRLLEELNAPYEVRVLDLKKGEQRQPAYLAVNPMGKVPAIVHGDALITEQVAIFIYLADLFPAAGLAPALDDPLRGPYLRWLVFYAACFEPALVDKSANREPMPPSRSPYGDFETTFKTLTDQLAKGPYLLGARVSAADILWGGALAWVTAFKLVPETPQIAAYVKRIADRPAAARAKAKEAELAARVAG
jgi:glutathione S-transferase